MRKLKLPNNLTSLAYKSIKQHLLEGPVDEQSRLTEESLARQLGISKSPIREALNRLEAEGLIRIEPRRGAYLRRFNTKDIDELYDLREALEVHAVRTAKITPELIAQLKKSVRSMRTLLRANDRSAYIEEDVNFHAAIAAGTSNGRLVATLENLQNQIWLFRRDTYDLSSSVAADFHQAIVETLETGRSAEAQRAMREHIQNVRRRLVAYLAETEERMAAESKTAVPEQVHA